MTEVFTNSLISFGLTLRGDNLAQVPCADN